ncbi:carboxypeptidase regulatory-like domain-containing protein [Sphingomonas lutea]|uniref:Carboxypeptidase regulatory-like domain-containing protein n=1 Tax=Sphingomonas lutea TaxID=1045317 RepID=A0A7G9SIJ6_9SPHN|nr:carboxypeptidase-like regulatory domain-containing protein [Sphingomonas lutea]QNN67671.1 carboxypeptidase regulatory-like domain-containing protein [Sphingomonas lutea]
MAFGRTWLGKAAMLLALGAGSIAASAPGAQSEAWTADPETQFLLDVNIRQLRLGDGVRAYATPEGTCVVLGDFLTALDVPMRIDLTAKRASGWAFKEKHRIAIDLATMTARFGAASEPIAPGTIRETPEGWCADTAALTRWFGIGVKAVTAGSVLKLDSKDKLPVELAIERTQRAKMIKKASFDLGSLPQVRLPYRMWRAPALDFVVNAGLTYRASDGMRVDRQTSVYAAGEIARLSYDAQLTTNQKGLPENVRLRAFRSDPEGKLLGPLKATHFGLGDVAGYATRLSGSAAGGRGGIVTNRPLVAQTAFDRTRFEGDLPLGWEAEIYRNGELLGFAKPSADQRYVFEDVQLLYGDNRIEIRMYGPQGQERTREEQVNVGQDNVPKGKTWYWAGVNQPGRDLLALTKPPDSSALPKAQAAAAIEHGVDQRTSVGVLARAMLVNDERLTFVEGNVRRSIGSAMVEVSAARETGGGVAARAQLLGKIGPVNVNAEALIAKDFHLQGERRESVRDLRVALDAPIKIGRTSLPAHADVHLRERPDGTRQVEAAARLAANLQGFNLATDLKYRKTFDARGGAPPPEVNWGLIGTGRVGDVRLRGGATFDVSPSARFRSAELSAYWSASDNVDWEGDLVYEAEARRGRARISHIRRLNALAIALTGEASTDGAVALGVNLNFSLDPRQGMRLSRTPLAQNGIVRATVYRDLNDNGIREPSEPLEKGALVLAGTRPSDRPTDAKGAVTVAGLPAYAPITVGIDQTSLTDPMLTPKRALQVVVPRPGIPAEVEIGLVGGGDAEGMIVKSGGVPVEGVELELIDAAGKVVQRTQTDFDGFFLFERIPYGRYAVRVAAPSAAAAKIASHLDASFEISGAKSIVRLGLIHVTPQPALAAGDARPHSP